MGCLQKPCHLFMASTQNSKLFVGFTVVNHVICGPPFFSRSRTTPRELVHSRVWVVSPNLRWAFRDPEPRCLFWIWTCPGPRHRWEPTEKGAGDRPVTRAAPKVCPQTPCRTPGSLSCLVFLLATWCLTHSRVLFISSVYCLLSATGKQAQEDRDSCCARG